MPKPPGIGGSEGQSQARPVPNNLQITRLATATQVTATGKPISQQSTKKELSKEVRKVQK